MDKMFRYVKPEKVGIPSEAILKFIKQLEDNEVNIHSFLIAHDNEIFAEAYWKPFNESFQHRMYSVGKSFNSIAIGLLQEEGKLKITDYICDYFPEKLPEEGVHEYIKKITIKDMLTMRTAHSATTYNVENKKSDWVGTFFSVGPTQYPGTIFSYDTSAALVLSALVEKLSGKSLMDYLREKVLDYVDFSEEAKFLPDPMGVSQGGSGLICTMIDLAKFAHVCMNDGFYNGKQLIPKEYLHQATTKQVDTFIRSVIDEQQGYGFQIWKSRYNGFTFYGMGGQLAVCLPQYKMMFITTADTQENSNSLQDIYDAFWQQIYPYFEINSSKLADNKEGYSKLCDKISNLSLKPIKGELTSIYADKINGKKYVLESNAMNLKSFKITFKDQNGLIEYENSNGQFSIPFEFGKITQFEVKSFTIPMLISAAWKSDNILCFQVNLIGENLGSVRVNLGFNDTYVTVSMKKYVEGMLDNYAGIAIGSISE